MRRSLFLLPLLFAFVGCDQSNTANENQATTSTTTSDQQAVALPSVPLKLLEDIWKEGTQVDYIFYEYPFTMSLTDSTAIRYSVRNIAETPAPLKSECKAAGRITYQIRGNIVLEGNFYFSTGCTYFVFEEKGQKVYSNLMTDEGISYLNGQINEALKIHQNAR